MKPANNIPDRCQLCEHPGRLHLISQIHHSAISYPRLVEYWACDDCDTLPPRPRVLITEDHYWIAGLCCFVLLLVWIILYFTFR